ncbi:MAG: ferrous iron transport protein B [Chloroflexota bacterium]
MAEKKTITVALTGQPNVGKSTVFNLLTGLSQHVGNWPGKTIEQKRGTCQLDGAKMELIDLPGTYSLTANSAEEVVARDYIIKEHPDVVVAILDAAHLERNLYLVAELLPLPVPIVVGLNMIDVAKSEGLQVDCQVLETVLGVPVVPMVATKNIGVRELVETINAVACGSVPYAPKTPVIRQDHQEVLREIQGLIANCVPDPYPLEWVALKLLEGDRVITSMMQEHLSTDVWDQVHTILHLHEDAIIAVAGGRYDWIARLVHASVTRPRVGQISLTDRLDRVATHPVWGQLFLAAVLGLIFWLTYAVGTPLQGFLDTYVVQAAANWLTGSLAGAPPWLSSLVVDGMIGGVGTVITFLPILLIFFGVMGILEDMGYMARGAYVMDRFMHVMGLHGKSFLPLFVGFGCNVPAVMGARILESSRARLLTILLAPLVPCTARMAVVAFVAPIFFGSSATLVSWGLLSLNLIILALSGMLLNKLLFKGRRVAFIMELPLYHLPNWRTIGLQVWQRLLSFLQKAGTLVLVMSVGIWALSALPYGEIETSYLASFGRLLAPIGEFMGLDWRAMMALLTSFIAKENAIATMGILYGGGAGGASLVTTLKQAMTPAAALAFLVAEMLFIPCAATVAVTRQETNSWKWTIFSVLFLLVVSMGAGIAAYQLARLWL